MKKVRDGYKITEIGEIPSEWKVKKLGEITIGKGEYGIGASATEYIEGKPRYLRITDIGDSCRLLFNEIKGLDDADYEKYILKEGDIVFARTGNTTGKGYVYNREHGELVYAGFLIKYSIDNNIAKHNFIKYVIQSKRYWDWVSIMSTRSGQPGINSNEYSSFIIQLPPLKEQEKIASILSTVDEQIDNVDALIEKNKELKKGLMQTLLTKGIGHTKIKKTEIGEIPEEWEVRHIEEICEILDSKRVPLNEKQRSSMGGDIPYYGANAIVDYINDYLFDDKLILIAEDGGNFSDFRDKPIAFYVEGKCWVNNHAHVLRAKISESTRWIFYSLVHKDITNIVQGGTRAKLNQKDLRGITIAFPKLEEQIKIVNILFDIDSKIDIYISKKYKLEQVKKGLMQKLLTGKIRVI